MTDIGDMIECGSDGPEWEQHRYDAVWKEMADLAKAHAENAALRAEVERLREEQRWIAVEERLPTTSEGWVLCSLVGDEVFFGCWHKNEWWSIDDRDGKLSDVTHWQPLPDPPVEE